MRGLYGLLLLGAALPLHGQSVSLTAVNSAYTQNFNSLATSLTTNNLALTGWSLTESGGSLRDNEQYASDTGASTTGDVYSYGSSANSDRALGTLRTGTLIGQFGAAFTNNTGETITQLDVGYTGEQWRLGAFSRTDRLDFQYSLNATSLSSGTWTDVNQLDFSTPNMTATGAKDGNSATNRTALFSAITGLSIAPGATFWVRWTDFDASGADDGLAVDDFSLTASSAIPEPSTYVALVGTAALGFAAWQRRRRTAGVVWVVSR